MKGVSSDSLMFLCKSLHLISMQSHCCLWERTEMSFVIFPFLSPHIFSPQHWACVSSRRCYWVTVEQRGEPLRVYKKTLLMRGNGKKGGKEAVSEWENMARVLMRAKVRETWRENQEMGCRKSEPNGGMSRLINRERKNGRNREGDEKHLGMPIDATSWIFHLSYWTIHKEIICSRII